MVFGLAVWALAVSGAPQPCSFALLKAVKQAVEVTKQRKHVMESGKRGGE